MECVCFCVFKKYDQIDVDGCRVWELFDQLSSETDISEYIDFDIEVVTSLPAIDQNQKQKEIRSFFRS